MPCDGAPPLQRIIEACGKVDVKDAEYFECVTRGVQHHDNVACR
jgi:hypothetical protein